MLATKDKVRMLDRLRKRSDFLLVQGKGKKWVSKGLILQAAPNNGEKSRFGLTVTKKLHKNAVDRNRVRRRLRAVAYDILPDHAAAGMDYVLIGRHETTKRPYKDLQGDLLWCLKKMDLLKPEETK